MFYINESVVGFVILLRSHGQIGIFYILCIYKNVLEARDVDVVILTDLNVSCVVTVVIKKLYIITTGCMK
jgi:hypothetical protein